MDAEKMNQDNEFSIGRDLQRRIRDCAQQNGTSPEELVRRALDSYELKTNGNGSSAARNTSGEESLFDALNRVGLVGAIKDGPGDVSTNPKYFEGFGESE